MTRPSAGPAVLTSQARPSPTAHTTTTRTHQVSVLPIACHACGSVSTSDHAPGREKLISTVPSSGARITPADSTTASSR
ncbi:hypothetical protein GCM10020001_055060 [Nonomuraea salmonea]